ncbi:MAG: SPOR domain-containing protein [Pseudomonadota bacterium]
MPPLLKFGLAAVAATFVIETPTARAESTVKPIKEASLSIRPKSEKRRKQTLVYTIMKSAPPTSAPSPLPEGRAGYLLQAGAFEQIADAEAAYEKLGELGHAEITTTRAVGQDYYRVQLGAWATQEAAVEACSAALTLAVDECEIVPPTAQ